MSICTWRTIFPKYCLELVKATLSQYFVKPSTVETYYGFDLHFDMIYTTALDWGVQLMSTSNSYSLQKERTLPTEREAWNEKEREIKDCTREWTSP